MYDVIKQGKFVQLIMIEKFKELIIEQKRIKVTVNVNNTWTYYVE